ncbi:MAG: hypothetical protein QOE11_3221 [Solirubrobacteraceae bacterium]|jgi:hypothetical protein|nr:hypothetical protein [Solirubrobacteraceae bacterium]
MDERPVAAFEGLLAAAICAVVLAALTYAVAAATAADPGALWRGLVVGLVLFGPFGAGAMMLTARMLRTLEPRPLPAGRTARATLASAIAVRLRATGFLMVVGLIALTLALSQPGQAVYLASIGLGAAPGLTGMAWIIRVWERRHGLRLVGPAVTGRFGRRTVTYYAIPAPDTVPVR